MNHTPLQPDAFAQRTNEYDVSQPLITKFLSPVPIQTVQTRSRLLALLHQGLSSPLILVSAPAGSGKTTLLSQWMQFLAEEQSLVAWVSLDASDNEPQRFWNVLFTALVQKLPIFRSLQVNEETCTIATLLTLLINTSITQQEPIVFVLDDYQAITDSVVQEQMTYLIEHLPSHMHIVIATRVDPDLPLARLRVRGQIVEMRGNVLRFTYEEATLFLHEVMHLPLTTADIIHLVDHVDGWIAGLCLAGYAMDEPYAAEDVATAAHGSQRYILDYILEELLSLQEEHVQRFLVRTAFLTHFSALLCDEVLDRHDSWQILRQMECANLFLIAEDHEHRWYHYQTLFAEALRCHLERTESELVLQLHRRASHWYERHGFLLDALEHLCALHDWAHAAVLFERLLQQQSRGDVWASALREIQLLLIRFPEALVQLRSCHPDCLALLGTEEPDKLLLSSSQEKGASDKLPFQKTLPAQQQLLDPLSNRETEVLHLMAQGNSNGEIAHDLVIATATAKRHVSNILSKLQATNRTQAVTCARHLGLLY